MPFIKSKIPKDYLFFPLSRNPRPFPTRHVPILWLEYTLCSIKIIRFLMIPDLLGKLISAVPLFSKIKFLDNICCATKFFYHP
jgi:hypothetical protein